MENAVIPETVTQQMNIRLPREICVWLMSEKEKNRSSLTSEVTRAVRERKQRVEAEAAHEQ